MKNLAILLTIAFSTLINAETPIPNVKTYNPVYEIISVSPMCPGDIPEHAVCMAYGSVVKIKAKLNGCLDKVVKFNAKQSINNNVNKIKIKAVAIDHKDNSRVLCRRLPEDIKTITIEYSSYNDIEILNYDSTYNTYLK